MIVLLRASRRMFGVCLNRFMIHRIHRLQDRIVMGGRLVRRWLVMSRRGIDGGRLRAMIGSSPMIGFRLGLEVRRLCAGLSVVGGSAMFCRR